tara:strand:+ start:263 stop:601 length:339 start_codon:yes stop_codon:yes gene_type:complete
MKTKYYTYFFKICFTILFLIHINNVNANNNNNVNNNKKSNHAINIDYAADNGNVENFSLAEPFLSNPVERHIAFQMRKTKLLNEARRRYKEKEEEQMRILENSQSHFSSYFF